MQPYLSRPGVAPWDVIAGVAEIYTAAGSAATGIQPGVSNNDFVKALAAKLKSGTINPDEVAAAYFASQGKGQVVLPPKTIGEMLTGLQKNESFKTKVLGS